MGTDRVLLMSERCYEKERVHIMPNDAVKCVCGKYRIAAWGGPWKVQRLEHGEWVDAPEGVVPGLVAGGNT